MKISLDPGGSSRRPDPGAVGPNASSFRSPWREPLASLGRDGPPSVRGLPPAGQSNGAATARRLYRSMSDGGGMAIQDLAETA